MLFSCCLFRSRILSSPLARLFCLFVFSNGLDDDVSMLASTGSFCGLRVYPLRLACEESLKNPSVFFSIDGYADGMCFLVQSGASWGCTYDSVPRTIPYALSFHFTLSIFSTGSYPPLFLFRAVPRCLLSADRSIDSTLPGVFSCCIPRCLCGTRVLVSSAFSDVTSLPVTTSFAR